MLTVFDFEEEDLNLSPSPNNFWSVPPNSQ